MKHIEKIYHFTTGEETFVERDFTKQELDDMAEAAKKSEKLKAEAEAKAGARQAILDRLGLTEEEAKLLLG